MACSGKPIFEANSVSFASEKGEEGDRWRRGVEDGELFGLKEGVERFGVCEAQIRWAIVEESSGLLTFKGSTREGFPKGVSSRPSGSKDF